jgi:AcrR family transcriptional regulator
VPRARLGESRRRTISPKRPDGRTLRRKRTVANAAGKSDRRQDIFDAAALLMRRRGFVGTTIEEVAKQLAVTKAALYYYVENKEELLYQISTQTLGLALERIGALARSDAAPAKKLSEVIDTFVHLVAERPEFFTVYFQEKGHLSREHLRSVTKTERRIVDAVRTIYDEGVAAGKFRKLDPAVATFGLLGLCFWVYQWYRPAGRLSVEQVSAAFQDLAAHGYTRSTN